MTCIKTGCHAYLEEYDEWLYGDAYEFMNPAGNAFPSIYAFRIAEMRLGPRYSIKHFTIHRILAKWDDKPYGTILATYVTNHGYEGVPV